jgi:hypothetical protein
MVGLELMNVLEEFLKNMELDKDPPNSKRSPPLSNNKNGVKADIPKIKETILKRVQPGGSLSRIILEDIIRKVTGVGGSKSVEDRIKTLIADGFLERVWDDDLKCKIFKVKGDTPRDDAC